MKLGPEAIQIFKEALDKGSKKIPYCGMLILGKEKMGKTSLYRQLVGKEYMKDLESTEGIDNNTVETVDRRNIAVSKWEEKEDPDMGEQFGQALAGELAGKFNKPAPKESSPKPATEEDLLQQIFKIRSEIEKAKEREERERRRRQSPPQFHQPIYIPPVVPSAPPPMVSPLLSAWPPSPKRSRREPEPPTTQSQPKPMEERPSRPNPPVQGRREKPAPPPAVEQDKPAESPSEGESTDMVSSPERPQQPPPTTSGGLNRRQSSQINQIVKGKVAFVKKPLPLVLNVLDFAGQKMYKPMHHCFISRRAIYIVVFKIPDMVKFIDGSASIDIYDPMEEIIYWLQSIHAHIYPPDPDMKSKDEAINRVILVGTHQGVPKCLHEAFKASGVDIVSECSKDDLKKIDEKFEKELIKKEGCNSVKHIYPVKECGGPCNYFIPVENSIDKLVKGKEYLKESGTKLLQDLIKTMSSSPEILPFLNEVHPIKWLKFEERLKAEEQAKIHRNDKCQIMKIEDVKQLALKSGIADPQQQDLALTFFHDTGKIIYLSKFVYEHVRCHLFIMFCHHIIERLPTLFLSDEEKEELKDLIVLQPHWLISVMKKIVELNPAEKRLPVKQDKITALEKGVADVEVLHKCWEEFLSRSPGSFKEETQIRQLRLILQAHCLIYPVHSPPAENGNHSPPAAENSADQKFIVPCKLPEEPPEEPFEHATFYFDFCHFLPDEIYHRLICLATAMANPGRQAHQYSRTKCIFYGLHDTNWVMELEEGKQRLKISVIM